MYKHILLYTKYILLFLYTKYILLFLVKLFDIRKIIILMRKHEK